MRVTVVRLFLGLRMQMKYSFHIYIFEGKTGRIDPKEMEHVADLEVPDEDELSDALNQHLSRFLRDHGLYRFIPLKKPSMEERDDGTASVCYYHNQKAHDIVYQAYPEWIMMPNAAIEQELNELYAWHGLEGWTDPRVHAD